MNEIAKRSTSTALSNELADRLLAGIEDSQATTMVAGGGKDLIKLDKSDGSWVIGQADEPMQVGSRWWINILSLSHGWVCWSNYQGTRKNERLGEIMVPMSEPKPQKPQPIEGFPFAEQRSFECICLNGEDAGVEVAFRNGSVGTMKAFKKLEDAIKTQLRADRAFPCPVVQFKSESYKHADYGKIQNPIFEIVDWANLNGDLKSDGAPEAALSEPKPAPAAAAKAARPAKPALVEEPAAASAARPAKPALVEEPVAAPRTAQRRRPSA